MRRDTHFLKASAVTVTFMLMLFSGPFARAEEDVAALKQKIAELEKRIEQLEAQKDLSQEDFFNGPSRPRHDPFDSIRRMQDELDQMMRHFRTPHTGWGSGLGGDAQVVFDNEFDLRETDDGYEIQLDLRGLDQDKVDVEIKEHSLTVTGQYSAREKQTNPNSVYQSSRFGSFIKTIPLPIDADTSKVKTTKKGDSLVITVPKKDT